MAEQHADRVVDVDDAAWRVLSDLMTPGGEFAALSPEGLQQLIQLRLQKEATRLGVPVEALARAFERATVELRGQKSPPSPADSTAPEREADPSG